MFEELAMCYKGLCYCMCDSSIKLVQAEAECTLLDLQDFKVYMLLPPGYFNTEQSHYSYIVLFYDIFSVFCLFCFCCYLIFVPALV